MNGAFSQVDRIRLFLLAVVCCFCFTPAAHAIRPPTPAEELQLKGEAPCQQPLAYWSDAVLDAELRTGLFCINNPLRYTDPTGHDFVLNAGLVNGPVPYMTAKSTLGQIGASVYNMFPLVDNSIHQGLRGVAAVDRAAGDALHATTLAVTGDSQLAENSRNLTLLVGGLGEVGKIEKVGEAVSLEQRANELHSVLDPVAQRMRTTAVTATEEGVTYVSSSRNALSPAQKAALKPGEVAAEGAGHAEVTGVNAANQAGHTPTATAASRPICPTCAQTLQEQGVKPASPLKKTD